MTELKQQIKSASTKQIVSTLFDIEIYPNEDMDNLYYIVYEYPKGACYKLYPKGEADNQ